MPDIILPKNKGIPHITWCNKHPVYKTSFQIPISSARSIQLDFCQPDFDIDNTLQAAYVSLIFAHGVLAKNGRICIKLPAAYKHLIKLLVAEVLGERAQRVEYIVK